MRACSACGHPLAASSTATSAPCPGCGRPTDDAVEPTDWRTDTAERPRVATQSARPAPPSAPSHRAGREPPHVVQAPPPARFPLYADELTEGPAEWPGERPSERPPEGAVRHSEAEPSTPDWFTRAAEVTQVPGPVEEASVAYLGEERRTPVAWIVVALVVVVLVLLGWWYLARAGSGSQAAEHHGSAFAVGARDVEVGHQAR